MNRLILVRHGTTDWNENGRLMGRAAIELNQRGREQAGCAAAALSSESVGAIYASPQLRARQTAEALAALRKIDVVIESGFDEVWLSAAWQGKTLAELRGDVNLERVVIDPMSRCAEIEPMIAVQERTVAAVEILRQRHAEQTVVVFSHGDPLRAIVAHYVGLALARYRRLACDNAALTIFSFREGGPKLELLNWRPPAGE